MTPEQLPNIDQLKQQHLTLVEKSTLFSEKDKESARREDAKIDDPKMLQAIIEHFGEAERKIAEAERSFEEEIEKAIAANLFSKHSKDSYVKWFRDLTFTEKTEYNAKKSSDLHNPKRKEILGKFMGEIEVDGEYIPKAIRAEYMKEFKDADFEGREKLVKKLAGEHKKLKAQFLRLPRETREKYKDTFKKSTLKQREQLLKTIAADSKKLGAGRGKETLAGIDEGKLMDDFRIESQRLVEENLLTPQSKAAYDHWFEALPPAQKVRMLTGSELHTRLRERKSVHDEFYALPEEKRKHLDFKFRNSDLDKRKKMLAVLKNNEKTDGGKEHYPDLVLRKIANEVLEDPEFQQDRLILTMLQRSQTLRRRAEIHTDAKETEKIAKKTAEAGAQVDKNQTIYLNDLIHHGDRRFGLKRFLKTKQEPDARATNMTLLNKNKDTLTAEQFKTLIVDHRKQELIARFAEKALGRLPQADPKDIENIFQKMNLEVDLRQEAA